MAEQLDTNPRCGHKKDSRVLGSKGHVLGGIMILRSLYFLRLPYVEDKTCAGTYSDERVHLLAGEEFKIRQCQQGSVMLIAVIPDCMSVKQIYRAILVIEFCTHVKMIPEVVAPLNISITFKEERGITHTNLEFVSGILPEKTDSS